MGEAWIFINPSTEGSDVPQNCKFKRQVDLKTEGLDPEPPPTPTHAVIPKGIKQTISASRQSA